MEKQVIVLYSGDAWLSTSSLCVEGIFSNEGALCAFLNEAVNAGIITQSDSDMLMGASGTHNRTCELQSGDKLIVEICALDPKFDEGIASHSRL